MGSVVNEVGITHRDRDLQTVLRTPLSVTESRNLKANRCLLVLYRGTRAIVAADATTHISRTSRELAKKINMMACRIAGNELKLAPTVSKARTKSQPSVRNEARSYECKALQRARLKLDAARSAIARKSAALHAKQRTDSTQFEVAARLGASSRSTGCD
jgi:hypothetical protein